MAEKMTLEQVRDWHRKTAREKDQTGELRFPGQNESPFYRFPTEESKLHDAMADAIAAHLAQPAQAVGVGAIREVIHAMDCTGSAGSDEYSADHLLDCINDYSASPTRAIGNAQAEGWRDISTAPHGSRKVIALISNAGPGGYVSDPWTGWIESDGKVARWPHPFPPTHWMPLPAPPTQDTPNAHE